MQDKRINTLGENLDLIWVQAQKRVMVMSVVFSTSSTAVNTLEGTVHCGAGDAIITGVQGEQWPVEKAQFVQFYEPIPPTVMGENGYYSRFPLTVDVAILTCKCHLELPNQRGILEGKTGDWLVCQPNGSLGVVVADIFAKSYQLIA
jgi:hypothetical protein